MAEKSILTAPEKHNLIPLNLVAYCSKPPRLGTSPDKGPKQQQPASSSTRSSNRCSSPLRRILGTDLAGIDSNQENSPSPMRNTAPWPLQGPLQAHPKPGHEAAEPLAMQRRAAELGDVPHPPTTTLPWA